MARKLILSFVLAIPLWCWGQSYSDNLLAFRQMYKEGLLIGSHALKPADTPYVQFYPPDEKYVVQATFVNSMDIAPILLHVKHGGVKRPTRCYGYVYFNMGGASIRLYVFQFMGHENDPDYTSLFIPFCDMTNNKETFLGGRYMDISTENIKNNRVIIDFNTAYNPHTAYEKGYPYIIPPDENKLKIEIHAGEKIFGHNPGY